MFGIGNESKNINISITSNIKVKCKERYSNRTRGVNNDNSLSTTTRHTLSSLTAIPEVPYIYDMAPKNSWLARPPPLTFNQDAAGGGRLRYLLLVECEPATTTNLLPTYFASPPSPQQGQVVRFGLHSSSLQQRLMRIEAIFRP